MIRIANRNDITRIVEMEIFVNRYNFKNILPNDFLYGKNAFEDKKNWIEETFVDMEKNKKLEIYVFEDDNIVKGYFSIAYNQNEREECELLQFLIDVPFQNNGYGKLLIDYCLKLAKSKELKVIWIEEVFEQNIAAIKLYEKVGFKIIEKKFSNDWNLNAYRFKKDIE